MIFFQELLDDATMCQNKMDAATDLIKGLGGEQIRWTAQSLEFRDRITRYGNKTDTYEI